MLQVFRLTNKISASQLLVKTVTACSHIESEAEGSWFEP